VNDGFAGVDCWFSVSSSDERFFAVVGVCFLLSPPVSGPFSGAGPAFPYFRKKKKPEDPSIMDDIFRLLNY